MSVILAKTSKIDDMAIAEFISKWDHLFEPPFTTRIKAKSDVSTINEYVEKLFSKGEVLVSMDADTINGLLGFYCNDIASLEAYIPILLVAPDKSGMGIGSALLRHCLDIIESRGFKRVIVQTWSTNKAASGLYQKNGFTIISDDGKEIKFIKSFKK